MMSQMIDKEKSSKLGVLEDLIKYMRKLELAKDEPEDALSDGLAEAEGKMHDDHERSMEDVKDPEVEIAVDGKPDEAIEEIAEDAAESDELSPFEQKMKDYFNDTDKPKMGNSMSFMVAAEKPVVKREAKGVMEMGMAKKKKRGRPFRKV